MNVGEEVNARANVVADAFDAMVFVYSGAIDGKGYGHLIKSIQPSDEQPLRPNSVMLLTTLGGNADYAYQIARLLQSISSTFYLCLPSACKSAGTLITLGASEIFMTSVSELGPLDVQLRRKDEIGERRSGMVVRTALDGLADEVFQVYERVMLRIKQASGETISFEVASRIAASIATGVMTPVYAQISPEELGNDLRDLAVATEYGTRLVERSGNANAETVRRLVEDYPTHEFIIDNVEADDLFNIVKRPPDEIQELISELGGICYVTQSPHMIGRLDGNFSNDGSSQNDGTEPAAARASEGAGVDTGRKAKGRGNRKRERAARGKTGEPEENGNGG